jgi:nicotinate phosphoribosyltransferase
LAASPVDFYGVGTSVVTGSGYPTAGMVYKLVARQDPSGSWVGVAKVSTDKASKGGRKAAFRTLHDGVAVAETVVVSDGFEEISTASEHPDSRPLQVLLVDGGDIDDAHEGAEGTASAREHHMRVREEMPVRALALSKSDPAIPTVFVDAE